MKARTQAANQLRDLIVSAPESLRSRLGPLPTGKRVEVAARFRPGSLTEPAEATKAAMRSLALRHQDLSTEIDRLDEAMGELVPEAAPKGLLDRQGVGPQVAATLLATAGDNPGRLRSDASFAALCGASPVDASSGKQVRHRLNRGGDRQANSALWRIVRTRMEHDPRTKAYVARRTAECVFRCIRTHSPEFSYTPVGGRVTASCHGAVAGSSPPSLVSSVVSGNGGPAGRLSRL